MERRDLDHAAPAPPALGCSKCRYAINGCGRCRQPGFRPRSAAPVDELREAARLSSHAAAGRRRSQPRAAPPPPAPAAEPLVQRLRRHLQADDSAAQQQQQPAAKRRKTGGGRAAAGEAAAPLPATPRGGAGGEREVRPRGGAPPPPSAEAGGAAPPPPPPPFLDQLEAAMQARRAARAAAAGGGGPSPAGRLLGGRRRRPPAAPRPAAAGGASDADASDAGADPRVPRWHPPASPYGLLEEELYSDPWRLLVACVLLNKTTAVQVRRVVWRLFDAWPSAAAAAGAPRAALEALLAPLGLHRRRAAAVARMSAEYAAGGWRRPEQLHGVGRYAADAYDIFVAGRWRRMAPPADKDLRRYWDWLAATGGLGAGFERAPAPGGDADGRGGGGGG